MCLAMNVRSRRQFLMLYIGIDNGVSGAIAALCSDGSVFRVDKAPATDAELLQLFRALTESLEQPGTGWEVFAVLEHAQSFPKMGSSSAFNYGRGYGAMQMALHAAEIPFDIVVPRKWQAALSCLSAGDKNVTKRRAEQLFPKLKITHAIADALLMAEYCRRIKRGTDGKKEVGQEVEAGETLQGGRRGGKVESQRREAEGKG